MLFQIVLTNLNLDLDNDLKTLLIVQLSPRLTPPHRLAGIATAANTWIHVSKRLLRTYVGDRLHS
jgi:hypothetical protein